MKNRAKEFKLFTGSFNTGLVLTVIFVVGTYFNIPPMSTILNISESFKHSASEKYGEPPYGHAESSSLKMFAGKEKIDLKKSLELLQTAGINVQDEKQVIKDIARKAGKSPQEIYEIIKPATIQSQPISELSQGTSAQSAFLERPQSGLGKKVLGDVCSTYSLDLNTILEGFRERGIVAEADQTLKQIGDANNTSPMQIYEAMKEIVENSMKN
jgi:hypothetical protein